MSMLLTSNKVSLKMRIALNFNKVLNKNKDSTWFLLRHLDPWKVYLLLFDEAVYLHPYLFRSFCFTG